MSIQGSFTGTTANERITPTITWSAVQSVVGNYSDITAQLSYRRSNSYVTGGSWSGSLRIGDTTVTGKKWLVIKNTGDAVAISATARVYHQDDGTLSVTISATGKITDTTLTSTTIANTVTLDTIARASAVSAADANIGSRTTVVVTRRASHFTHSIAYRFGSCSGYINAAGEPVEQEVIFSDSVVNFALPDSFYTEIPDAPSGRCTLTCTTYDGSNLIGQRQSATFTATASAALCAPTVSGTVRDGNPVTASLTGDDRVLVRYASTALCTITAAANKGAQLVSMKINNTPVTESTLRLPDFAGTSVTFSATDSRGYTTTVSVPVTLIPYVQLTNNATVRRTGPTADTALLTLRGNCWQGNFGAKENVLVAEYAIEGQPAYLQQLTIAADHTYSHTVTLSGLDYTKSYRIAVTVTDGTATRRATLTVQKGIPVFDWGENDFRFHVSVELPELTVGGISLADYIKQILEGDET